MNAPTQRHKRRARVALATTLTAALACGIAAPAHAAADPIAPVPDAWGRYYVDSWNTNTSDNKTPETNAAIGLLSPMLDYWEPNGGANPQFDANDKFVPESVGTIKNRVFHDANIAASARIADESTPAQKTDAYLIDRRNQNYSAVDGLGPWEAEFRAGTNSGTTIPDEIPADATTVKYEDKGSWGSTGTTYGAMVDLVEKFRGSSASTNPSKEFYDYARPFRWSSDVKILSTLDVVKKTDAEWATDGGYPSGHTNAGWLATYALAYSAPERYQELLTNASEIGNSRIVAGMHSPADVIGGRMMSTAVAAAALNNPANAELKQRALDTGADLLATTPEGVDAYGDRDGNEKLYRERLTYGLPVVGDTTLPVVVPKGAEVLIESRLPYLTGDQRRWVLQSTGLPSGHALLDDAEGWGRLNLFAAADGYSAFDTDVTVEMDAADGGFSAADVWRNDIDGAGSLTKSGTGSLILAGDNTYTGDTTVEGGSLVATSSTAFGAGDLIVTDGVVSETASAPVIVGGDLTVDAAAELHLTVGSATPTLQVSGDVEFAGSLRIDIAEGFVPADDLVIARYAGTVADVDLAAVEINGLPEGYTAALEFRDGALHLVNETPGLAALTAGTASISGVATVGKPLTLAAGEWGPAPVQLAYQWYRGTEAIPGATALVYTPGAADLGQRLSATVTGTKAGYASQTQRAEASGVVTVAPAPSTSPTPVAPGALAATGTELPTLLPILALSLLVLGAGFFALRARVLRSRRA